ITDIWTSKTAMPTAREALTAAVVNNKIYAIGGVIATGYLATVGGYNPATHTLSPQVAIPTAPFAPAAPAAPHKISALCGSNDNGGTLAVEEYQPPILFYLHQKK